MRFIKVEDLKYVTEDIHTFYYTKQNKEYSLEEYCKIQNIKEYENIDISEDFKAWQENLQELSYLKNTDFYFARLAETKELVLNEVITKRTEARNRIRELLTDSARHKEDIHIQEEL